MNNRSRTTRPIIITNTILGSETRCPSIKTAATFLGVSPALISQAVKYNWLIVGRYKARYEQGSVASRTHNTDWVYIEDEQENKNYIYKTKTAAAKFMGCSIGYLSQALKNSWRVHRRYKVSNAPRLK